MDEELLISADSPKLLLKYTGQIHVRDLAIMLEEILYFYRPNGDILVPFEMEFVLMEYDKWVVAHEHPIDPELLQGINAMLSSSKPGSSKTSRFGTKKHSRSSDNMNDESSDNLGFYSQLKLVSSLHLHDLAMMLSNENSSPTSSPVASVSDKRRLSVGKVPVRQSARWSDIRLLLDANHHNNRHNNSNNNNSSDPNINPNRKNSHDESAAVMAAAAAATGGGGGASKTSVRRGSVEARWAARQQKQSVLHIANSTVSFKEFSRWVYGVLKCVAEKRREELEYHLALDQYNNRFRYLII